MGNWLIHLLADGREIRREPGKWYWPEVGERFLRVESEFEEDPALYRRCSSCGKYAAARRRG